MATIDKLREVEAQCEECESNCGGCHILKAKQILFKNLCDEKCRTCTEQFCSLMDGYRCLDDHY